MHANGVMASMNVTDLDESERWYTSVIGRGPDARPMKGLLEWHLGENFGFQVWCDPMRAGSSTMVIEELNLDTALATFHDAGIDAEAELGGGTRIAQLHDPDDNIVVITEHHD